MNSTTRRRIAPPPRAVAGAARFALATACAAAAIWSASIEPAAAMDTDIFSALSTPGATPNVLIVLDNTSNWSRQAQHWPGGISQGQAEADAIKKAIQNLPGNINVGLLEFVTGGSATDNGGYVRFAVSPVGQGQGTTAATNRTNLSNTLTTIYNNITSPNEKQNSGTAYGNLMYDAFNYFGGFKPFAASGDVVSSLADSDGYTANYTQFKSPLSDDTSCATNYIIFIGNPDSRGPTADSAANLTALTSAPVNGDGTQLKMPVYSASSTTVSTLLGQTSACYASQPTGTPTDYASQCPPTSTSLYNSCTFGSSPTGSATSGGTQCTAGQLSYPVYGNAAVTLEQPTGTFVTDTATYNADEWARAMHEVGIPVGTGSNQTRQTVATYTIDVYKDQPNATQSSLLASMARAGGGKYFAALNEQSILDALNSIFSEIQAVNSTFASAALPISATNRAQNANQVYIGMFRPDQTDHPRWFGNLKRYQVDSFNGYSDLGGADGQPAVSSTTGFVAPCALSWWTTDAGNYWYDTVNDQPRIFITQDTTPGTAWQSSGDDSNFAKGTCGTTGTWSDKPDGQTVEKGAAAEMLRNQGSRSIYTVAAGTAGPSGLTLFNTTNVPGISSNTTVNANIVNFISGQDVTGEIAGTPSTAARPSIHGEVIHSRPLPVDYGGSTGVVVYYGAGDGVFHAVSGNTGKELWSFVAPETYAQLQRLMDNSPLIQAPYPTPPGQTQTSGTTPKQFYFDGSTGQYQNADNSKVWIFPAMRRGGRMLYGFDVTNPTAPTLKWRRGCPDLNDDTGCTSGMSAIGQTWSTPQIASVNGYTVGGSKAPVVIVGGGYDGCEDADSGTPACSSPKGAAVYVLDADSGAVIKSFSTSRSVIADPALVDTNYDGVVDAAYFVDTGGNIYRLDFPTNATDTSTWALHRVAYTNVTPGNSYRKFEFAPAVLPYQGKVYVAISTGDREHPLSASYPYTTPVLNRFYVYLDDQSRTTATDLDGTSMADATATPPTCTSAGVLPGSSSVGWHMDLNSYGAGEQGVTSPLIIGGMVTFSTNRPVVSGAMCTTSLGEARGYWVNLLNGSGAVGVNGTCGGKLSQTFIGGGLPPSPVAATVSVGGTQQTIVIGSVSRDSGGPSSAISAQQVRPPITNKRNRTYWKSNTDTR